MVQSGDGQSAAPGTAVAVVPSVLVRDAASRPVPGVTVTFSADSGGGVVTAPVATTNSAGVAFPGAWTLGATEGPQVLGVVAGSLPKLKVRAMARIPTTTITTGTVTTGGGTLTVNQPASPLNGVAITIQNTSVTTSAPITIGTGSTVGIDLPAGVTATSPALMITSSANLTKPAIVRFPITPIPGKAQFVGVFDPATGRVAVVPPHSSSATELTAILPRLESSLVAPPAATAPSFLRFASAQAGGPIGLFTMGIDIALLDRDFTSEFRAGVDNWDFDNLAIAWLPFLAGTSQASPAEEVIDPAHGMISTSLWYFLTQRSGGQLHRRFRLSRTSYEQQGGNPMVGAGESGSPRSAREGLQDVGGVFHRGPGYVHRDPVPGAQGHDVLLATRPAVCGADSGVSLQ